MSDWWMENGYALREGGKPKYQLIDCGYVNAQVARDRADRIIAALNPSKSKARNKRFVQIAGWGRILIHVPDERLQAILEAFPDVKPGGGYCWTTHAWLCKESTDLKYAMR